MTLAHTYIFSASASPSYAYLRGQFLFLQVYYAPITEFLRFQPSPLQRSIDTG
ncbi:hypothetical protein HMPREF9436_03162 [Faecalibacterium cf. prausnitzii KLE1255]|uniref:Uncharacterized protein n=1 Tax=Faecalibacterium cf. prausnitzii KLE1255 TaxID=748224 RepID=E2ZN84_9FIRM|nr:hypothetical protein HMPREF9436_03162 [Faecalibacterium cf. prausnitzii KLE1255]